MHRLALSRRVLALFVAVLAAAATAAPQLEILLPLARTAYQTNEAIDLALVRSDAAALPADNLLLVLSDNAGSRLQFTFPVAAVALAGEAARATEHLHLDARLLRPGHYTLQATVHDAVATVEFDLYSHVRQSSFVLINWGRAQGKDQLVQGENSLGFNLFYGHYGRDTEANFIRAGVDYMNNCTMSGGHQMDLRMECDWSDPYVLQGGRARVVRQALMDRTRPNVYGVHFYDEPGLTWYKHPATGETTPHNVPAQDRSFASAFGKPALQYHEVDAKNPEHVAAWEHWGRWKLGFMDAAWKDAEFGVSYVRPDYLSVTQSQYGFTAFTDGYYFNVVRSLPVISGHGGYHDWGPGYWNPSWTLEMARARDLLRPCWYLPAWYGNTTSDEFRLEQYLSFQTNIQGMMSPPDIDPFKPATKPAASGVVESNKIMARLGTIFTTLPVTRPPVAMLYSLSHLLRTQAGDMKMTYAHADPHGAALCFTYLAGKLLQQPFQPIVDEDILDGTLAAQHRAVILASIQYLDPALVAALEDFAARGGLVLKTSDCTVAVKGAVDIGMTPALAEPGKIAELQAKLKAPGLAQEAQRALSLELAHYTGMRGQLAAAAQMAKAIKPHLDRAGIAPVFVCDQPGISATRQAAGDVEYLFAVNATHDPKGHPQLGLMAAEASISLPNDGRPVYDAVRGGAVAEFKGADKRLTGTFLFGPGQMRVFARTTRPIGTVRAATPVVRRDSTDPQWPLRLDVGATVLDEQGGLLSGSMPLRITVTDALGAVRYDLFRATDRGLFTLSLPLALNDPAGTWTVMVQELLAGTSARAVFALPAVARGGAVAGATWRAVAFGQEAENLFRFFRVHKDVKLVTGASPFNQGAAVRLAAALKPWGVRCTIVPAAELAKPRILTADEAVAWVGLGFGRVEAGKGDLARTGFAVEGPVVLLGNPDDNSLIKFLAEQKFLPYAPDPLKFPGAGRGYLSWQLDGVSYGAESVTLLAYDEAGMAEAVGACYEAAAGLEPLTRWRLPVADAITPAVKAEVPPAGTVAWTAVLPERAEAVQTGDGVLTVVMHNGAVATVAADGTMKTLKAVGAEKAAAQAAAITAAAPALAPEQVETVALSGFIVKFGAAGAPGTAVGYWGGLVRVLDAGGTVKLARQLDGDITGLAWLGDTLAVGLADGRVVALKLP